MSQLYHHQVELLLEVLPFIMEHESFALKGGTALNLFHLDMPRLSVDIDLCYLPVEDRQTTLSTIQNLLNQSKSRIEEALGCRVISSNPLNGRKEAKLIIEKARIQIKVEPNYTIRGTLFPPVKRSLLAKASQIFNTEIECICLDFADLMGGKLCAALDRQHPRDLFDVWHFLNYGSWSRNVVDGFIFYLLSHNRPMHELLNPNLKPIEKSFVDEFKGMTDLTISVQDLEKSRTRLVEHLRQMWKESDKEFLISFISGSPKWELFCEPSVKEFPAIKWKILNIEKMNFKKKAEQIRELENLFR